MQEITASFDAVARKAHNAARDAYNEAVLSQYRRDREFRAAVHAVASYAVATMPNPDGSKKIAAIVGIRDMFDGELGLIGTKDLVDAMPQELFT
jgi:ribosomal protein L7/L12